MLRSVPATAISRWNREGQEREREPLEATRGENRGQQEHVDDVLPANQKSRRHSLREERANRQTHTGSRGSALVNHQQRAEPDEAEFRAGEEYERTCVPEQRGKPEAEPTTAEVPGHGDRT